MPHGDRRYILPDDSPYLANLAALWNRDAKVALCLEQLDAKPSLALPPLMSQGTPKFDPTDRFAFACVGFTSSVIECFEKTGGTDGESLILVFEAEIEVLRAILHRRDVSDVLASPRVILLTGEEAKDPVAIAQKLARHPLMVSLGFTLFGDNRSALFAEVRAILETLTTQQRTHVATALQHGRKTAVNVLDNLAAYATNEGIGRLENAFSGHPAVIVSAGPSLRKNIARLRGMETRAVIIAVQTALKPLLEAGVAPQFVCSIDHHEISTRFYSDLPANLPTELVAEPKASAAVIRAWTAQPGRRLSLLGNAFAESVLREMNLRHKTLPAAATVAHLAFSLAEWLGCSSAILIGQDLGFSDGLAYAPGTGYDDAWRPETGRFGTYEMKQWEHIARDRHALLRVRDWKDNWTYTEERLAAYLSQFERMFADSDLRVVDATEGGVAKRHTERMPLVQALAEHCEGRVPPVPEHSGPDVDRLQQVNHCLKRRVAEAQVIADVSERTLPLLERVHAAPSNVAGVNAAVAEIDLLRQALSDDRSVDRTYQLAADLTQQSERDRYLADLRISAAGLDDVERRRRQCDRDRDNVRAMLTAARDLEQLLRQRFASEPTALAA